MRPMRPPGASTTRRQGKQLGHEGERCEAVGSPAPRAVTGMAKASLVRRLHEDDVALRIPVDLTPPTASRARSNPTGGVIPVAGTRDRCTLTFVDVPQPDELPGVRHSTNLDQRRDNQIVQIRDESSASSRAVSSPALPSVTDAGHCLVDRVTSRSAEARTARRLHRGTPCR